MSGQGQETNAPSPSLTAEGLQIIAEEENNLKKVLARIEAEANRAVSKFENLDDAMIELRDMIAEAKEEDVSSLVEQMHQVAALNAKQGQGRSIPVDPANPYFGHLRLQSSGTTRARTVLIGKRTLLDEGDGISIVDWRNAPVSRLFYRYDEGDDYEEEFDDRLLQGTVLARRSLMVGEGRLRRIDAPQGTFVHLRSGIWREQAKSEAMLQGGLGTATRIPRGQLGVNGDDEGRLDKRLQEITALIDKEQFGLITQPDSGIVLIQGGAGSGKTTVALHRVAYLAYQDPRRFAPSRVLIMVFNEALVEYIKQVLPSLGVEGVTVTTYRRWSLALLRRLGLNISARRTDATPEVVSRFKKHSVMLKLVDELVADQLAELTTSLSDKLGERAGGEQVLTQWQAIAHLAPAVRCDRMLEWLRKSEGRVDPRAKAAAESVLRAARTEMRDVLADWMEIFGDASRLEAAITKHASEDFNPQATRSIIKWCNDRATRIADFLHHADDESEEEEDDEDDSVEELEGGRGRMRGLRDLDDAADAAENGRGEEAAAAPKPKAAKEPPPLDAEDDAILLRLLQAKVGGIVAGDRRIDYAHIVIDEAQDLCPIEMRVLLDCATEGQSVTIAGDRAQKMIFDNGFSDWPQLIHDAGLDHVAISPLKITYRSTRQVMELARHVLGPLAHDDDALIAREGAPVAYYAFGEVGESVAFLADSLRTLMQREPSASVALITRFSQQAEIYYEALRLAEVPRVRLVTRQDFTFQPGIDVTDVRHVKGLEFDYVIVLDPTAQNYPEKTESRHLLHIACTRTAYQLWLVCSGKPSALLPPDLLLQGDFESTAE